jgi:hypothetical protein
MNTRPFLVGLLSSVLALSCGAGLEKDLGQGVKYFRIADLEADAALSRSALTQPKTILDLRGATGSKEAVGAFAESLKTSSTDAKTLRIVLVSPRTVPELVAVISAPRPRQLTVGARAENLKTDIAVATPADADLKAYQALESGTPLEKLISSNPEKRRFDEAALARTHANGNGGQGAPASTAAARDAADQQDESGKKDAPSTAPADDAPVAPAATGANATPEVKAPAEPPLHDLVLERALQLHRALSK